MVRAYINTYIINISCEKRKIESYLGLDFNIKVYLKKKINSYSGPKCNKTMYARFCQVLAPISRITLNWRWQGLFTHLLTYRKRSHWQSPINATMHVCTFIHSHIHFATAIHHCLSSGLYSPKNLYFHITVAPLVTVWRQISVKSSTFHFSSKFYHVYKLSLPVYTDIDLRCSEELLVISGGLVLIALLHVSFLLARFSHG